MRSLFLSGIFMLSFMPCVNAVAAYPYFAIRTGVSDVAEKEQYEKADTPIFGSGAIGLRSGPLRVEGEYTYLGKAKDDLTKDEVQLQRLMANAYLDLQISRYATPYIGGGAGIAFHDMKTAEKSYSESAFAWNAGVGVGFHISKGVTLEGGYRYVDMGKSTVEEKDLHFTAHETYAGIRFGF